MVFSSLKGKCIPYHKPGQTGKGTLPSYNTPTEPFQSRYTHITSDNRMILWTQNTRKWVSPGKLSPINGLLRKCFLKMKSLPTLHVVPVLRWFVWLVCLIDTALVPQNDALRKIHLIWFCESSMRSVFHSHLRNWRIKLNLTMLRKITL